MKYKLQDLIDVKQFQSLQDMMNEVYSFTTAILDNEGNILTASGWQDICTKFHRVCPESCKNCKISDSYILSHAHEANPGVGYKCMNGLYDYAFPIIIDGVHYGNFFTGQFLFEKPDKNFFKDQAKKYGFDEVEYLNALDNVPVITQKRLDNLTLFLKELVQVISSVGLQNLKQSEANNAIAESHALYHDLVETAQDLIWQADAEGRYTYLNPAWEEVFGYKNKEMIGKKFTDFQTKEWARRDLKEFEKLIQGNKLKGLETVHLAKDGKEIHLVFNAKIVRDKNGVVLGTRGTAFDISNVRKVEEDLKESKRKFMSLFASMNEGVALHKVIYDETKTPIDYRILEINPAFEKQTGFQIGKAKNLLASEFYGTNPAPYLDVYAKVADTMVPTQFESYFPPLKKHFSISIFSPQKGMFATVFTDITERKETEEALRLSEEKFRLVFQTSPDSININRLSDGLYVDINDGFTSMVGYTAAESVGNTSLELNIWKNSIDRDKLVEGLNKAGKVTNLEAKFIKKNGESIDGLMSAAIITLNNEPHLISITRDISEIKATKERLEKSEIQFRTAFENSAVGMCLTSMDGKFLEVNSRLCQMLGYSDTELLHTSFHKVTYPDDVSLSNSYIEKIVDGKTNDACFEKRYLCKDGKIIWGEVSTALLKDADGKSLYLITHIIDITERKLAEKEIQESAERYKALLTNLEAGIVVHAPDSSIVMNNNRASELLGLSDDQLRGKQAVDPYWKFIHEDNTPFTLEEYPVNRIISTKKPFKNLTLGVIQSKNCEISWLTVNGFPVFNNEKIVEIVISFIDISEQIKAQLEIQELNRQLEYRVAKRTAELEAANNELQSFVYSVSHDLRAPLRSIMGFSEIISRRHVASLNAEGKKYFGFVMEASRNMANLIDDLLHFSRLSKKAVDKEIIELNEIFEQVLQNLNQDILDSKAIIVIPDKLPTIYADSSLILQILSNLISNSIKYHRIGVVPEIIVSVEEDNETSLIKITDNGQGIPKEHQEKIFNIFQRLHSSEEYSGTGIGLSIVKKAVNTLGGKILVESSLNVGSTFTVVLNKNL
ncbi:MAG: PAS domain S-box protein [Paludibacter sp.]|nr:PAS domain S-box protein [Paludibacter sp.]